MMPAPHLPQQQPEGPADRLPNPGPLPAHEALLREIAADARHEPERYLADSVVPSGGE